MTVHVDLLDTGSLRETAEGREAVVNLLVTEVTGDVWSKRVNALEAPGVPIIGAQHPAIPDLVLVEREVQPATSRTEAFVVRLRYGERDAQNIDRTQPYSETVWSGSARSFTETTREDVNGRRLSVYYSGSPVIEILNLSTGEVTPQAQGFGFYKAARIAEVEVERPLLELTGERWERDDPERRAAQYQAHVNSDTWRGYAPYTALMREVGFEPDPLGGWRTRYRVTINPAGWRAEVTIQIFNQVPQDATEGNGIEVYDVLPAISFAPLAL